jgi:hypothetical protein
LKKRQKGFRIFRFWGKAQLQHREPETGNQTRAGVKPCSLKAIYSSKPPATVIQIRRYSETIFFLEEITDKTYIRHIDATGVDSGSANHVRQLSGLAF